MIGFSGKLSRAKRAMRPCRWRRGDVGVGSLSDESEESAPRLRRARRIEFCGRRRIPPVSAIQNSYSTFACRA
jgi:hypothetical protein